MDKPLIAISDSPFPNLTAAEEILSELDAEIVIADEPTVEKILYV